MKKKKSGKPQTEKPEAAPMGGGPPPEMLGAFSPTGFDTKHMKARGFMETGLKAVFPEGVKCLQITSDFGVGTRSDGSRRSRMYYNGRHGGSDIPAKEGTPIIAIADGTVIHKSQGMGIGGIGMILRHAPADTGLKVWTFTEYKHFQRMPDFEIGDKVRMGQIIGPAGKSGTQGGHYGSKGFSHLHLAAFYNATGDYKKIKAFIPVDGHWLDPVALFKGAPLASKVIKGLPKKNKRIAVPYKTRDGKTHPAGSKLVWPFICE